MLSERFFFLLLLFLVFRPLSPLSVNFSRHVFYHALLILILTVIGIITKREDYDILDISGNGGRQDVTRYTSSYSIFRCVL